MIRAIILRDLARAFRSGGAWLPLAFLLLIAALFPFAVGHNATLLAGAGGGMLWIAALLASLLPIWLSFGPPLLIAALPAGALLKLAPETLQTVMIGLALGTPGLAALAILVAALTAGLRGSGALTGLLVLPLAVPILIFGAGALQFGGGSALKLVATCSLFLCVAAPIAGGAALRAGRD
ncbi:MAG: heme exporter protein CcmB [Sphingomonadales bacterium]|nr:heme exporter protein CcmB [Sphingomonadales bacterium]